jgi:hypothetical protein
VTTQRIQAAARLIEREWPMARPSKMDGERERWEKAEAGFAHLLPSASMRLTTGGPYVKTGEAAQSSRPTGERANP